MRICIDMGHTPKSPGASGYFDELTEDRQLGQRVAEELERRGHTVYNSTPPGWMAYPDEMDYRSVFANQRIIDLLLSIHFNSSNGEGHGTEVLYQNWSDTSLKYATAMCEKVCEALGTTNRGPKDLASRVGVLRETNAPAILLEVCFCDNEEDAKLWWACSWEKIVKAICDSIDGGSEEEDMPALEEIHHTPMIPEKTVMGGGTNTSLANLAYWAEQNSEKALAEVRELRLENKKILESMDKILALVAKGK